VEGGNSFYPQVTGIASVRCKVHYNLSSLGKGFCTMSASTTSNSILYPA